jgi:hypothetical protein
MPNINKFGKVAREWKVGICKVKCSSDTRSIGGCSCANIYLEKTRDVKGEMPYIPMEVEPDL